MSFEEMQQIWRENEPGPGAAPAMGQPTKELLADVRRESRRFDRRIWWRDFFEISAGLLVAGLFGRLAWKAQAAGLVPWVGWVGAALPLMVAAFLLVDRIIRHYRSIPQGEPVIAELDRALAEVEHQAQLLRSMAWWYLLPILLSILLLSFQAHLQLPLVMPSGIQLLKSTLWLLFLGAFSVRLWHLNQRAVKEKLEPRLAALAACRRALTMAESG